MRGYKPVVGVRAFLVGDQTGGSATAKSDAVFFPHSAFPYHCCATIAAAWNRGLESETVSAEGRKKDGLSLSRNLNANARTRGVRNTEGKYDLNALMK